MNALPFGLLLVLPCWLPPCGFLAWVLVFRAPLRLLGLRAPIECPVLALLIAPPV
jgi:hypothetical protein